MYQRGDCSRALCIDCSKLPSTRVKQAAIEEYRCKACVESRPVRHYESQALNNLILNDKVYEATCQHCDRSQVDQLTKKKLKMPLWKHYGNSAETPWNHCGNTVETLRKQCGNTVLVPFGVNFRPFWLHFSSFGAPFWLHFEGSRTEDIISPFGLNFWPSGGPGCCR